MRRLLIIGTGGHGKVVLDCAKQYYDSITFMANDAFLSGIPGYPIIYEQETALEDILKKYDELVVAIGDNTARLRISLEYAAKGMKLATIIHSQAVCIGCSIAHNLTIGENSVLGAGSAVIKDVPNNVLAAGVPATIRKYRSDPESITG
ncbi:MAG: hypothetical protein LBD55_00675 [Treponema sp.]|jgi:acyl-[acyl carrier protein]--UDP-N-acetylglucosamine O-acyltransferase|nr:hypothetical protein [Treponema sp.]